MTFQSKQGRIRFLGKGALAIAVTSALGMPMLAQASSFQLPTANSASWGRAFAGGSLFGQDPTAEYNDPAAMAFITSPMIQASAAGIDPSAQFHGNFTDAAGKPVSGSNPNGFGTMIPVPNVAWVDPINDRLVIGGGITVPYGLVSNYNSGWQGRYFGDKTSIQSTAVSLSAGFKVNDEFSIGAGVVGERTKAQLNTTADPAGTLYGLTKGTSTLAPQSVDEQININVKEKTAFGYYAGFEFKPTQQDSFDFSYHSRIQQTLRGHYDVYGGATGKTLLQFAPSLNSSLPAYAQLPALDTTGTASASAELNMPAFANADWVHAFNDRFSLGATVAWTGWSSFQSLSLDSNGQTLLTLPQHYKDTYLYSLGGDYKINEQWTVRGGVGYDQSPVPTAVRDPRIPDGSRRLASVGVSYQPTQHFGVDLGYQHQFVGKVRVDQTNKAPLGYGSMDGYFDDSGNVVSLTGTYTF